MSASPTSQSTDREGRPERRAVDRDPAVAGPRALDDVDAVELGGARVARLRAPPRTPARRPLPSATSAGSARRQPPKGSRIHASSPIRAAAMEPSSRRRRRVGEPAEVAADAVAGEVDAADRAAVEVAREVELDPSGRADRQRAVARRRLVARVPVGPNRDDGVGRSRSASSLAIATAVKSDPAATARTRRDDHAADEPSPSHRRLAEQPPGDPEAGEQARPERARAPTDRPPRPTAGGSGRRAARAGRRRRRSRGQEQQRTEPQPDHRRERPLPVRRGRPGEPGERRSRPAERRRARPPRSTGPPGR